MTPFFEMCAFWVLVILGACEALNQGSGLSLECLGNVMKLTLNNSLSYGRQVDVEALDGSQIVKLTPGLASQCGYGIESDPWGNTKVYTSLLSCFAHNKGDAEFDIRLRLQLYGNQMSDNVYEVEKTCGYDDWASREILCERNFMEVSVHRGHHDVKQPRKEVIGMAGFSTDLQASTSLGDIWRMVFYTPDEKPMTLEEVQDAGYGVLVTPTRLVLRSPYNTPETYIKDENGMQMAVLKVSTYFKRAWAVMIIDGAAVCPTGGLHFTKELITWYMPRYIVPLMTDPQYHIIDMYMGIDGKRLSQTEMKARGYDMTVNELQIVISLPVGGPGGYYKSTVLAYTYHITFSIEPMLEMLWLEEKSEVTRYKVHNPITTPPMPQLLHITNNTLPDSSTFCIMLGSFLLDVELLNVTLSTGVMTVDDANRKGFNVHEHLFPNGSKAFSMEIPFSDPAVQRTSVKPMAIVYSLSVTFGLVVLPEYAPFSHSAVVEVTRKDPAMFNMNGVCDENNFYITIEHESQDDNLNVRVGKRNVSADLYVEYDMKSNGTHTSMTVPFLAKDIVFEKASQSSLRARIDLVISYNKWHFKNFSMACSFPLIMTECFPNGSITALAVKVHAAPWVIPSQLTLRDPSCKPTFSNERFAYFTFNANSCQTTRTFQDGIMTYRNRISMSNMTAGQSSENTTIKKSPEYRVAVVCTYKLTKTLSLTFSTGQQAREIYADPGFGELHARMRLAHDASYNTFYTDEDYPVVQYLKHALYFEVELMQSIEPQIELILENCWASTSHGGSVLTWDIIVNGCANPADPHQVTFYPVTATGRVPAHVRRFKIDMFTFIGDDVPLHDEISVYCEAVLCDVHQKDSVCNVHCPVPMTEHVKRGRRNVRREQHTMWVSSGKIFFSDLFKPE